MTRGDIVYVQNDCTATGHEQNGNRPAVIVSNDLCNKHSPVLEIVYLTSSRTKAKLPTHIWITTPHGRNSLALCEAVYSVDRTRIVDVWGHVSPSEMRAVDLALKISLGLI